MWYFIFFVKQKTACEMRSSDWSSDVCTSDLPGALGLGSLCLPSCALGRCAGGDPRGRRLVARRGHAAGRGGLAAAVVRCTLVAWGHTGARRLPRAATLSFLAVRERSAAREDRKSVV